MADPPQRVVVTHPRTRAARHGARHGVVRDVREQTALGEVYVKGLMRAQFRLAAVVCGTVFLVLGSLPLLLTWLPSFGRLTVLGVSLPWLVLGPPVYALLVAAGAVCVRRAERHEREFAARVHRS